MARKELEQVKLLFEAAVTSTTYRAYLDREMECRKFYDNQQWTQEEMSELMNRGQTPVVINKIRNRIKGLCGTEVVNRTRIGYGARSFRPEDADTADALSQIALYVQDKGNVAFQRSRTFEDALIGGIGAHITEAYDQEITTRRCDPRDVFWDISDTTPDLSDSFFRGFKKWFNAEELIGIYPNKKQALMDMVGMTDEHRYPTQLPYNQAYNQGVDYVDESNQVNYSDKTRGRILVVEIEYRVKEEAYEYVDAQGRLIRTFDKEEARKGRITKDQARQQGFYGLTYRELYADRYYTCQFAGDIELWHKPSDVTYKTDFDLQILCLDRTAHDNVPTGLVYWAMDAQKELNKRRSKMLHHLNTNRVVMDTDAVESIENLRKEASRPDAVIVKRKNTELRVENTTDLAKGQFDVMQQADREIQDTLGIYDELIGMQTNASSGVAIEKRQQSALRQQAPNFDQFKLFTKRYGELLMAYIQYVFKDEQVLTILDDDGLTKSIALNAPLRDANGQMVMGANGEPKMVNDIRAGMFDVYVKETLDVAAISGETLERLSQMLMNGQNPNEPLVLIAAGFSTQQATELLKKANELRARMAPQQPQEQVLPSAEQAGQAPTPQG
jgi:hypothetical protein